MNLSIQNIQEICEIVKTSKFRLVFDVSSDDEFDVDSCVSLLKESGYFVMVQSSAFSKLEIVVTGKS